MRLSDEAKEFEKWFYQAAVKFIDAFSGLPKDTAYLVDIWLFLPQMKNKSDGRYKKLDATNRVKFLEDVIAKALSIDDGQDTDILVHKREDAKDPRVEVTLVPDAEDVLHLLPSIDILLGDAMRQKSTSLNKGKIVLCDRHDRLGRKGYHISRAVCLEHPYQACGDCPNSTFVLRFRVVQ